VFKAFWNLDSIQASCEAILEASLEASFCDKQMKHKLDAE
jgi:hypothetical protein